MKPIKQLNKFMKGKTVKRVDTSAVNCTTIHFTDGTSVLLEAENVGNGIHGPVPYEVPAKPPRKRKVA